LFSVLIQAEPTDKGGPCAAFDTGAPSSCPSDNRLTPDENVGASHDGADGQGEGDGTTHDGGEELPNPDADGWSHEV
jgi:hypothetical protein